MDRYMTPTRKPHIRRLRPGEQSAPGRWWAWVVIDAAPASLHYGDTPAEAWRHYAGRCRWTAV